MQIVLSASAEKDFDFWRKSGNKTILKKISDLVESIATDPFKGIGKPEPLKHDLAGCWSRRINQEHRIVYEIKGTKIIVLSLKGHY